MDARPKRKKTNSTLLNMFATQPPLFEMTLRSTSDKISRRVHNAKGVKVIDILRVAEQIAGKKAVVVEHVFFPPEDVRSVARR